MTRLAGGLKTYAWLWLATGCARDVAVGHEDSLSATPEPADLLWSARHESESFDEWLEGDDGIKYVAGSGELAITSEHAHQGQHAFSATITADDGELHQAVMGRTVQLLEGRYGAWFLLPEAPVADVWVLMKLSNGSRDDRFDIDIHVPEGGEPRLRLYEHDTSGTGWITEPAPIVFPVGRWAHVEVLYRSTPESDGQLVVFQDGEQVLATGRRPTADDDVVTFYCGSVSWQLSPAPYRLFIDDASIGREAAP